VLSRLRSVLDAVFRRDRFERTMTEEMRFHMDAYAEDLVRSGVPRDVASRRARIEFGAVDSIKEDARQARGLRHFDEVRQDLHYARRQMVRSPGFTTVVVLTVAFAVGANAAIFGAIDSVLIETLPVREPEQLVFLSAVGAGGERYGGPPYPWFEQIRARSRSFDGMAVFAVDHLPVSIDGHPEQVLGQVASGSYFQLLGMRAAIGRMLTPDDEQLMPAVAVLGHRYWQRRFGGRRDVLGKSVLYRGRVVTIVGVTAPGFDGMQTGQPVDITFPVTLEDEALLRNTDTWWSDAVARVKRGVAVERAQAEVSVIFASLESDAIAMSGGEGVLRRIELLPAARGLGGLRSQLAAPLILLLGIMGAVLVIGCANIANLLAVRTAARRRELAVRSAIGAGRARLGRQLLTESLLLFLTGACAGLFVAYGVQRLLSGYLAIGRNPIVLSLSLDARVLGFAAMLTLLAGALTGLAPALRAGRNDQFQDLRLSRGNAGRSSPISGTLIVVQVAMSIVVLVGGSMFLRTLINLRSIDPGFRSDGVLTLSILPLESTYPPERRGHVWREVLQRVQALPGVESASLSLLTPLSGRDRGRRLSIPTFALRPESDRRVHVNYVSHGFFETLGIPVAAGRDFLATDDERAPRVAMVNATAARFYFGTLSPSGATILFDGAAGAGFPYTVIGVVADAKHRNMRDAAPRFVYVPLGQALDTHSRLTLAIRTHAPLAAVTDLVRQEVQEVGADILVSDIETLEGQVDHALLRERLVSSLSLAFAGVGLLLAALGLYGVAAYAVQSRTREIGIRAALGASPGTVKWLVLRGPLTMAAIGVGIGAPLSVAVSTTIASLLYEVSPTDPIIVGACIALLLTVTAFASYLPARRASSIDPMRALSVQ
jgi:predicted permease